MIKIDSLQTVDFMCGEDLNSSRLLRSFRVLFSGILMNWIAFVILMGKKS